MGEAFTPSTHSLAYLENGQLASGLQLILSRSEQFLYTATLSQAIEDHKDSITTLSDKQASIFEIRSLSKMIRADICVLKGQIEALSGESDKSTGRLIAELAAMSSQTVQLANLRGTKTLLQDLKTCFHMFVEVASCVETYAQFRDGFERALNILETGPLSLADIKKAAREFQDRSPQATIRGAVKLLVELTATNLPRVKALRIHDVLVAQLGLLKQEVYARVLVPNINIWLSELRKTTFTVGVQLTNAAYAELIAQAAPVEDTLRAVVREYYERCCDMPLADRHYLSALQPDDPPFSAAGDATAATATAFNVNFDLLKEFIAYSELLGLRKQAVEYLSEIRTRQSPQATASYATLVSPTDYGRSEVFNYIGFLVIDEALASIIPGFHNDSTEQILLSLFVNLKLLCDAYEAAPAECFVRRFRCVLAVLRSFGTIYFVDELSHYFESTCYPAYIKGATAAAGPVVEKLISNATSNEFFGTSHRNAFLFPRAAPAGPAPEALGTPDTPGTEGSRSDQPGGAPGGRAPAHDGRRTAREARIPRLQSDLQEAQGRLAGQGGSLAHLGAAAAPEDVPVDADGNEVAPFCMEMIDRVGHNVLLLSNSVALAQVLGVYMQFVLRLVALYYPAFSLSAVFPLYLPDAGAATVLATALLSGCGSSVLSQMPILVGRKDAEAATLNLLLVYLKNPVCVLLRDYRARVSAELCAYFEALHLCDSCYSMIDALFSTVYGVASTLGVCHALRRTTYSSIVDIANEYLYAYARACVQDILAANAPFVILQATNKAGKIVGGAKYTPSWARCSLAPNILQRYMARTRDATLPAAFVDHVVSFVGQMGAVFSFLPDECVHNVIDMCKIAAVDALLTTLAGSVNPIDDSREIISHTLGLANLSTDLTRLQAMHVDGCAYSAKALLPEAVAGSLLNCAGLYVLPIVSHGLPLPSADDRVAPGSGLDLALQYVTKKDASPIQKLAKTLSSQQGLLGSSIAAARAGHALPGSTPLPAGKLAPGSRSNLFGVSDRSSEPMVVGASPLDEALATANSFVTAVSCVTLSLAMMTRQDTYAVKGASFDVMSLDCMADLRASLARDFLVYDSAQMLLVVCDIFKPSTPIPVALQRVHDIEGKIAQEYKSLGEREAGLIERIVPCDNERRHINEYIATLIRTRKPISGGFNLAAISEPHSVTPRAKSFEAAERHHTKTHEDTSVQDNSAEKQSSIGKLLRGLTAGKK